MNWAVQSTRQENIPEALPVDGLSPAIWGQGCVQLSLLQGWREGEGAFAACLKAATQAGTDYLDC